MRQVLCLSELVEEVPLATAPGCAALDWQLHGKHAANCTLPSIDNRSKLPASRTQSQLDHVDFVRPTTLLLEAPPVKNTFIHYKIPTSPSGRPPTPTVSTTGILFLFRGKSDQRLPSDADTNSDLPDSSLSSDTPPGGFEQDSEASMSSAGDVAGSPTEKVSTSPSGRSPIGTMTTLEAHDLGQCTPCNYFWHKVDGCRQGSDCSFCHYCPKSEIKKRKKDTLKQLRKSGLIRRR